MALDDASLCNPQFAPIVSISYAHSYGTSALVRSQDMNMRTSLLTITVALAIAVCPQASSAQDSTHISGKVSIGTSDSSIGDYGFLNDSEVASKIFAECNMDDVCEVDAKILNEVIVEVRNVKKITLSPPPADAVWDDRYACLYGTMEGDPLSDKERVASCDSWGKLESEALDAGYCWNQKAAEYKLCGG